ncbi:TolC family protein [Altererythrobacter arenosus]|uniref:TolC family protein n=1 Tax=Altererythrobacter arenosus TaxID=3032592 RepID=A0ABY8FNN4_9SPHN|nr:TolC family protein [Altererythrobacter sp. CAU 1644]WFL76634.1 TolC family protein [Altererythrobacter sp. CAU 1644]
MKKTTFTSFAAAVLLGATSSVAIAQDMTTAPANTGNVISMQEAIEVAMAANPEILQAQYNTEAIQMEREQAQSLYLPRLDIEASAGIRRLENNTRRNLGIANDELYPLEAQVSADWTILDFGRRRGELLRQAARVDGASLRVTERSEFIALATARQYLDVLLQQRIVAAAQDNLAFHNTLVTDLSRGVEEESISIADLQQAEERFLSAKVRESEAVESLESAQHALRRLTGLTINTVTLPPDLSAALPSTEDETLGLARTRNPLVREAQADVDAAHGQVMAAKGEFWPTIGIDARGRVGEDIDGFAGETNDIQARVYLRWNVFDGGLKQGRYQEMVHRASQARYRLHEMTRRAEEDASNAWTALRAQQNIGAALARQSEVSDDLLLSYRSQFNVGRRSLLDVLDAQNTRFNTQVRLETSRFSQLFAQYQILAATNQFLDAMNIAPGAGAGKAERERFDYGPSKEAETDYRRYAD